MILGFFFLFVLTFFEIFCTKRTVVCEQHKNTLTILLLLSSIIVSMLIYFYKEGMIEKKNLYLLMDWKLYAAIFINSFSFFIIRKNYEINGDNVTAIQFSMLASLLIIILISYFLSDLLGFENTLNIHYDSINQMFTFIFIYFVLIVFFFLGKLKNKNINSIKLLIIMSITLAFSSFFNTKMMQTYNGYLMYTIFSVSSLILFSIMFTYSKEYKNIKSVDKKNATIVMIAWGSLSPIYIFINTVMPVEFLAIFKRVLSLISGFVWDKFFNKENTNTLTIKDFIIVSIIILTTIIFYYSTK